MLKSFISSLGLVIITASAGLAGDTVTINFPGGATQTVAASAISSMINNPGSANIVAGVGRDSIIMSVSQNTATGVFTITTIGGQVYVVSSNFISKLILFYD